MAESEAVVPSETPSENSKKKVGRPKGSKKKSVPKAKSSVGKRYDPKTKAKILEVTNGKKLSAAHAAAIGVGYRGTAASLYQMLYNSSKKKGKPGRPKGNKNKTRATLIARRPGRPPLSATRELGSGLGQIDTIVTREVQSRINAAARAAIKELEKLIK